MRRAVVKPPEISIAVEHTPAGAGSSYSQEPAEAAPRIIRTFHQGRAASIYLTVLRGENPEGSRAARHRLPGPLDTRGHNPHRLSTYSTLPAPTRPHPSAHWWSVGVEPHAPTAFYPWSPRLPAITHQLRSCAGPLGRAAPSIGRFPRRGTRTHHAPLAPVGARATLARRIPTPSAWPPQE